MKHARCLLVMATALLLACNSGGSAGIPTADGGGPAMTDGGGFDGGPDSGSTTGGGDAATDGGPNAGCGGPTSGKLLHPNPIISRTGTSFSNPAGGSAVIDGNYHNSGWSAGSPTAAAPSWVAIRLAAGPTRILVVWDDGGTYNYQDPATATVYGFPAAYHIDVSANSTNGTDGTWTTAVTITGNQVRTRAHAIAFTGQTWVKMVITAAPANIGPNGVQIGEIDVHDISSAGACLPDDTWFFMGDSITAFAYDRAQLHQPSFAAGVNRASPTFFPAMINGGIGGETSAGGLARLPQVLTLNPDYRFFLLSYGTNDAANNQISTAQFQVNMQSMITMVKAAGRTPIIPHIPFSGDGAHGSIPSYDTVIDSLVQQNQLLAGPDLYTYFMQNQGLFTCPPCGGTRITDNLHPNDTGLAAMNMLWTQAMRSLYP